MNNLRFSYQYSFWFSLWFCVYYYRFLYLRFFLTRTFVYILVTDNICIITPIKKKNTDVYRLFCCVSCKNKETVFRTRDANSAVNIRKLTRSWIETQTRPSEFSYKQGLSPVLEKIGKSKTIVVKTTNVEAQLIDLHT